MSVITLTTDFGGGSPYVAMMRGVILSMNPRATIVDITHDIPAQDIRAGAITLADTTVWFPIGSIHIAVIDPGVGSDRDILYAAVNDRHYILPDNGLLSRLTQMHQAKTILRLDRPEYWAGEVSETFHGRDVMAPVAAHLSLGIDPHELGSLVEEAKPVALQWEQPRTDEPDRIRGVVQQVDSFGNLVTNIPAEVLNGRIVDERVCIVCGLYETWGVRRIYSEQLEGTFIALIGSSGFLELAIVGDNAAKRLRIEPGTPVVMAWE